MPLDNLPLVVGLVLMAAVLAALVVRCSAEDDGDDDNTGYLT